MKFILRIIVKRWPKQFSRIDAFLMNVDRILVGRVCRWILNVVLVAFSALLVCMAVYAMSHNQYGLALLMTIVAAFTAYAARDLT